MALRGVVLKRGHTPKRTCTGCRAIVAQGDLVRVALGGGRLVLDAERRLPGRGAYVHQRPACVTVPGLARSLKRQVTPADVQRLVSEMSPSDDNSRAINSLDGDRRGKTALALTTEKL